MRLPFHQTKSSEVVVETKWPSQPSPVPKNKKTTTKQAAPVFSQRGDGKLLTFFFHFSHFYARISKSKKYHILNQNLHNASDFEKVFSRLVRLWIENLTTCQRLIWKFFVFWDFELNFLNNLILKRRSFLKSQFVNDFLLKKSDLESKTHLKNHVFT